jgi:hypothetical protein
MEIAHNYILWIFLLIVLIAVVLVTTGTAQKMLIEPLQDSVNWGTECQGWAASGCKMDKVPLKLIAAVRNEDNVCKELACGAANDKVCKCGSVNTEANKPFCCASRNVVYATAADCGQCPEANLPSNQVWYRCCQILISADFKSSCGCSN